MNREKGFSASQLKGLAMIFMLIDHTAYIWIEKGLFSYGWFPGIQNWIRIDQVMRNIGRLAFPIFCYFIAEGFCHTRNPWNYLKRLAVFALVSEIPFSLAARNVWIATDYRNVYWTLAFGLLALILYEKTDWNPLIRGLGLWGCFMIPVWLHTDYSCFGVLVIFLLYIFRQKPLIAYVLAFGVLMLQSTTEIWSCMSFVLLYFYNGTRGKGNKYLFYGFYPVHLLLLVMMKNWVCPILMTWF